MRSHIIHILVSLILFSCCNSIESPQIKSATLSVDTDTTDSEIYKFVNYLTEHRLLFIDSSISLEPFNFPDENNKESIKRMIIAKHFKKQDYYLSWNLYNCITQQEMNYMLNAKKRQSHFKWKLSRLKNLSPIDTNSMTAISFPLFTSKKDEAVICIASFGRQICNSSVVEMLFKIENGEWVEVGNFGNRK